MGPLSEFNAWGLGATKNRFFKNGPKGAKNAGGRAGLHPEHANKGKSLIADHFEGFWKH